MPPRPHKPHTPTPPQIHQRPASPTHRRRTSAAALQSHCSSCSPATHTLPLTSQQSVSVASPRARHRSQVLPRARSHNVATALLTLPQAVPSHATPSLSPSAASPSPRPFLSQVRALSSLAPRRSTCSASTNISAHQQRHQCCVSPHRIHRIVSHCIASPRNASLRNATLRSDSSSARAAFSRPALRCFANTTQQRQCPVQRLPRQLPQAHQHDIRTLRHSISIGSGSSGTASASAAATVAGAPSCAHPRPVSQPPAFAPELSHFRRSASSSLAHHFGTPTGQQPRHCVSRRRRQHSHSATTPLARQQS